MYINLKKLKQLLIQFDTDSYVTVDSGISSYVDFIIEYGLTQYIHQWIYIEYDERGAVNQLILTSDIELLSLICLLASNCTNE